MLKKINYRPVIEYGVLTGIRRNSIVLEGDEPVQGFDTASDLQEYVKVRKIPVLIYRDLLDENGELDPERTAQQYADYYANLEAIAVPFEVGLVLKTNHPYPISYSGKLYECIQGITVVDPNHTPDITHAHYSEIQAPAGDGYPAWVQPTGAHDAYQAGDRVTFEGKNYESLINANVWSPAVYPQGWEVIA